MQNDLIERLGGATGPCRELDAEIAVTLFGLQPDMTRLVRSDNGKDVACYYKHPRTDRIVAMPHPAESCFKVVCSQEGEWGYTEGAGWDSFCIPPFTSSIDAALTLVPEGWTEYTLMNANDYHEATFNNHEAKRTAWGASDATPALAICIAALRARP